MAGRQRTAITVTTKSFRADNLVVADRLFEPKAGGKMLSLKYNRDGQTFDTLRLQTPEVTIGQVWDNQNQAKTELTGWTLAINCSRLRPADMENEYDPSTEDAVKTSQRALVDVLEAIDSKVIDQISSQGMLKGKGGKNLTKEEVETKFTQTVHWPSNPDYTLGIRGKINCRDVTYDERKVYICDQEGRDISYWKLNGDNVRTYAYDDAFASLAGEPVFNIDALRGRSRVLRAVLESNNAWIQQSISCSWKIINIQVEVGEGMTHGRGAWAADDEVTSGGKRRHDGTSASAGAGGASAGRAAEDADIDELMADP
jgi:hypothetical protein